MEKKELAHAVIERLKEAYPDADCSLDYDEAWKLLVSVRLAAQCTDARVNVVVEDLYAKYPDVDALADATPEENLETITSEIAHVKSGEVTYAVRSTRIDGKKIKKGDIIGIGDGGLLANGKELSRVVVDMCAAMVDEDSELISIYMGADCDSLAGEELRAALEEAFPDLDLEIQEGGQPVYYCILSVE